jgi:long-subunit fatty acid transport protein
MFRLPAPRLACLSIFLLWAAVPSAAQLKIGQYADEAPLRTWNVFPSATASGLGRGTVSMAWAEDGAAAWANPALLASLTRPTLTFGGSIQVVDCHRFSLVNTGQIRSDSPLTVASPAFDAAAASVRWGAWVLAVAYGTWESYARPQATIEISSRGYLIYGLDFTQAGRLWATTFAAARRLGRRLSLGLSVHVLWGAMSRGYEEIWGDFRIIDRRETTFSGWVPQAGLAWDVSPRWRIGASVRPAWTKKGRSRARVEFQSDEVPGGIIQEEAWDDALGQPWIVGLGSSLQPLPGLTLAADAVWFDWSGYAPSLYGEPAERAFRDVLRLSAGAEYRFSFRLFGLELGYPLRAGLVYDPQPMRDPRSTYLDFSVGTGLEWKGLRLDIGVLAGRENGSGSGLTVRRVALGLSVRL